MNKKVTTVLAGTAFAALGVGLAGGVANAAPVSDWDRLAQCESGGNWAINTGNGYQGGLQFHPQTWIGHGGGEFAPTANQATKAQQIAVAERVLASQGWGAWPACSSALGLNSAPELRSAESIAVSNDVSGGGAVHTPVEAAPAPVDPVVWDLGSNLHLGHIPVPTTTVDVPPVELPQEVPAEVVGSVPDQVVIPDLPALSVAVQGEIDAVIAGGVNDALAGVAGSVN